MLPILVVGGVIGAVVSALQGASWISDQLGPSNAASAGGKGAPKSSAEAKTSPFETALAAAASLLPATHGTDYNALARMKAGITAYSHVGEHRANHPGSTKQQGAEANGSISPS
jgi:hypothetical protein